MQQTLPSCLACCYGGEHGPRDQDLLVILL